MGIQIRSPRFSFVQLFGSQYGYEPESYASCNFPNAQFCLPVFAYDDVAFQFVVQADTEEEANELCSLTETNKVEVGLVDDCGNAMNPNFTENGYLPEKARISATQVLYNWPHGFPGFDAVFAVEDCFRVKVIVHMNAGDVSACSNCFQRINDDCFSTLLEYGAEQNIFGFNYCGSGAMFEEVEPSECEEPFIQQFVDTSTLDIEYTDEMREKYGDVPTVEVWIEQGGQLVKPMIQAGFDAYPPTRILADLGGAATGFIKIS